MRYATVGLLLTCLLACLLAFAALTALRDAPAYGAERVGTAGRCVPGHTCAVCRGLDSRVRRWCPAVNYYWQRWHRRYLHHDVTKAERRHALIIMWRESRGLPGAVNPSSGAAGLMQLLPGFSRGIYDLCNPRVNISIAGQLFCRRGFQPWQL